MVQAAWWWCVCAVVAGRWCGVCARNGGGVQVRGVQVCSSVVRGSNVPRRHAWWWCVFRVARACVGGGRWQCACVRVAGV